MNSKVVTSIASAAAGVIGVVAAQQAGVAPTPNDVSPSVTAHCPVGYTDAAPPGTVEGMHTPGTCTITKNGVEYLVTLTPDGEPNTCWNPNENEWMLVGETPECRP